MKKHLFAFFFLTILAGSLQVACDSFIDATPVATSVPANTRTPSPTATPNPTPVPFNVLEAVSDGLEDLTNVSDPDAALNLFIDQLKTDLRAENWGAIPFAETFVHSTRPFALQSTSAENAAQLLSSNYLTNGDTIRFNIPVPNQIDTGAFYNGSAPLVYQLASTGWGVDGRANSVLYIVAQGDTFAVGGVLIDYNEFMNFPTLIEATQPRGTIVQQGTTISQIDPVGAAIDLFTHDGPFSINASVERALLFESGNVPQGELMLLDLTTGQRQTLPLDQGLLLAQPAAYWLDATRVVLGVWDDASDEGPNFGHPIVVDTVSGASQWLDIDAKMTSPPAVANGRVMYSVAAPQPELYVWEAGANGGNPIEISAESFIALGAPANDSSVVSPAIADDGRAAWWIKQTDSDQITLVALDAANQATPLLSVTPPAIGGWPNAARWQPNNGSWLAVESWSRLPWESGVWLFNTAQPGQQFFLGNGSSHPVWAGGDRIIYHQWVDGRLEVHQFDAVTQQQVRITVAGDVSPVAFQPAPLDLTVSAEIQPHFKRGVPAAFYTQPEWEAQTINLFNIFVQRGSARLELRVAPRGTYLCVIDNGCDEVDESSQYLEQYRFLSSGLNQVVESYAVFDGERHDRVLFTDVDGHSEIKAYGYNVRASLEAIGDYSLTESDIEDSIAMLESLWISSERNSGQQTFTVEDESQLLMQANESSPDRVWASTAYVYNAIEPEAHEMMRFAGGKHRQLFVVQKQLNNQTWRVRDDWDNGGLGMGHYIPVSYVDNRLFFTYRPIPDGGGCTPFMHNYGLWRLNLNNGSHAQQLPNRGLYAFNNDFSQIAVSTPTGFELITFENRAKRTFSFGGEDNLYIQQIQFTPSGESILLSMYVDTPDCRPINQLLLRVDLEAGTSTLLREHFGLPLTLDGWLDDELATLIDSSQNHWVLDIEAGELMER